MAKKIMCFEFQALLIVYLVCVTGVVYAQYRSSSVIILPSLMENDVSNNQLVDFKEIVEVKSVGIDGHAISKSMVVGISVGGVCVVLLIGLLGVCLYKLGKRRGYSVVSDQHTMGLDCGEVEIIISETSRGIHVEAGNMVIISIQDLKSATNDFSQDNILGRGGFGTVYKGELHDGTKVAVKRTESGGVDEFKSEIAVLTKVRHRHLVALLGCCLDGDQMFLVYEYMPQGTLSRVLFDWKQQGLKPLEWTQRLMIALDVARGVEYLHCLAQESFVHRDLKPCNILLGDDMRAKVADFGLVRPAPHQEHSFVARAAGTIGYFAPEYAGMGRVTTKIDVFSFGVILMELITGRRALDARLEKGVHLMQWFRMHIDEGTFGKAIDPALDLDEEALDGMSLVAKLAGHCCASEPHRRPDMSHVVSVLSSLSEPWNPADSNTDDSCEMDVDEEELVHLFGFGPSVHDPRNYSEIVGWKPSEHYPLDDSDSHETEIDEEPLARVVELSGLKPSEHDSHDNCDTDYSEIVGWKPSEHYPLDDTDEGSCNTEIDEEPLVHEVEVSSVKPSEYDPHDGFDTAYSELVGWKPSEHYPLDDSDTDDDSYETDFDDEALVNVVELADHGCASVPHNSHVFDVFSPMAEPGKPSEPEPDDGSSEIYLDEEALASVTDLFGWKLSESDPDDDPNENDLVEEALVPVAELFSWKPCEHDRYDYFDTDYSVGWKPSEHYPHDDSDLDDDSCGIDIAEEALASVVELARHSHASEPHQSPGKILALEVV